VGRHVVSGWPESGLALWSELERHPGRVAVLVGVAKATVALQLAELRGVTPVNVGAVLAASAKQPSEASIKRALKGHPVLTGIEVLLDPLFAFDVPRLLTSVATSHPPLVVVWPGDARSSGLCYPGDVRGIGNAGRGWPSALVLHTQDTSFADDAPFTVERFS
jgi:hypothetical protein